MTDNDELLSAIQISAANRRFDPLMAESIRLQSEAARRAVAAPDTTAMQKAAYARAIQGQQQQMAGMALASATPEYRGIAGHTYQQGSEAQGPTDFGEGIFTPGMGYVADPVKARDRLTKTMAAQAAAAREFAGAYGQQEDREAGRAHQAATLAEQQRHARAVEANARATLAQGRAAGRLVAFKGPNDEPYFMDVRTRQVFNPLGGAVGGVAPPKLTEGQGKAATFGTRAREAEQALESVGGSYSPFSVALKGGLERVPGLGGALGMGYNVGVMGGASQQAEQAQRNFINAVLRRESGAVINPDEFTNARQQYFPQPGDSAELLAQKKQNRETAIRGLTIEAGPGGRYVGAPSAAAAPVQRRTVGGRSYVHDGVGWKPE